MLEILAAAPERGERLEEREVGEVAFGTGRVEGVEAVAVLQQPVLVQRGDGVHDVLGRELATRDGQGVGQRLRRAPALAKEPQQVLDDPIGVRQHELVAAVIDHPHVVAHTLPRHILQLRPHPHAHLPRLPAVRWRPSGSEMILAEAAL